MPDRDPRRPPERGQWASLDEIFGGGEPGGRPTGRPTRPAGQRSNRRGRGGGGWRWAAAGVAAVVVAFGTAFGATALLEGGGGSAPVQEVQASQASQSGQAGQTGRKTAEAPSSPTGSPTSANRATPRHSTAGPALHVWRVTSAAAYDPLGDGQEHDSEAPLAIDGDPDTAWTTDIYTTAALGGLKPGVGLVLDLGTTRSVRRVVVTFGGPGTSMAVYVGSRPGTSSHPAATVHDAGSTATVATSARGRYVTLWLTTLPPADGGGYRGTVAEVRVSG